MFLRSLFFLLLICSGSVDAYFEMLVRSIGQGNSIAIKSGNKAIIIDSGYHQSGRYQEVVSAPHSTEPVLNFLADCEVTVFITHPHYDHFSFLDYLFENSAPHSVQINSVYCSDFAAPSAYVQAMTKWRSEFGINVKSVNSYTDVVDIGNTLGSNIIVDAILPETWPMHGKGSKISRSKDPNDNSMVIVINDTEEGKKFLFPGDATGATLDYIVRTEENVAKLRDVDCMIVPHHGSNLSGAFIWVNYIRDSTDKTEPLLAIVSSDPDECDFLPWFSISQLCYWRRGILSGTVTPHPVNVKDAVVADVNSPIFVTANSTAGFFKVVSANKSVKLYDGKQLLFQSNIEEDPTSVEERVFSMLLQMQIMEALGLISKIPLTEVSDKLLRELSCYSGIRDARNIVIEILKQKLALPFGEISEGALVAAMEYSEAQDVLLDLFSKNMSIIPDSILFRLSTYNDPHLIEFTKQVVDARLQGENPSDTMWITAMQYSEFASSVKQKLLTAPVTEENIWIKAIHYGFIDTNIAQKLAEKAIDIPDSVLSKLSSHYDSGIPELTAQILTSKLAAGQLTDAALIAAMKYEMFHEAIAIALSNSFVSDTVLHEAMRYEIFNEAIYRRLAANVPLEEEDFIFYVRHLKDFGNLGLLHRIIELPWQRSI